MTTEKQYYTLEEVYGDKINPDGKDDILVCDSCKHEFLGKDVLLEEKSDNVNLDFAGILGMKSARLGDKKLLLVCPKCHATHLFGFDVKS